MSLKALRSIEILAGVCCVVACESNRNWSVSVASVSARKTGTSQSQLSRKLQPLISLCVFLLNLGFHQLVRPLQTHPT